MTLAAAKFKGFATTAKGSLGWKASCETCRWSQMPDVRRTKGEASFQARAHNAEAHGENYYCGICDFEAPRKEFRAHGQRGDGTTIYGCRDEAGCAARVFA